MGRSQCLLDEAGMTHGPDRLARRRKTLKIRTLVLGTCVECSEGGIFLAGQSLALIERGGRHHGNFFLVKAQQIGMADEIVGVGLVVSVYVRKAPM